MPAIDAHLPLMIRDMAQTLTDCLRFGREFLMIAGMARSYDRVFYFNGIVRHRPSLF